MRKELKDYLFKEVIPMYKNSPDPAHGVDHIKSVMMDALYIANRIDMSLNDEIIITAAAFHDIGLLHTSRENHHNESYKYVKQCKKLKEFFTEDEINTIAKAVKEHRASYKGKYNSIYSCIISDADRDKNIETMITRSYKYNRKHNPELNEKETYISVRDYLRAKYDRDDIMILDVSEVLMNKARKILKSDKKFKEYYNKILNKNLK